MAIVHTPRTLVAIARGMLKRHRRLAANGCTSTSAPIVDSAAAVSSSSSSAAAAAADSTDSASRIVGFVPSRGSYKDHDDNAHVYRSRPNVLWDVDYLGHMNNSSYLTHAEYARWEWMAETGSLRRMYEKGMHFMVTNSTVRFRKEIGLRDPFEIHSLVHAIDDRHVWLHQTFRGGVHGNEAENETTKGKGRILAQVLVQAVAVVNRKVVHPSTMLEAIGAPEDTVDTLLWDDNNAPQVIADKDDGTSFLERFRDLDEAFRTEATADDERLRSASTRDE